MRRNAGKVILLKKPKTTIDPSRAGARRGVCSWRKSRQIPCDRLHKQRSWFPHTVFTGIAIVRSIRTRLHATTSVSIALEKVCVW